MMTEQEKLLVRNAIKLVRSQIIERHKGDEDETVNSLYELQDLCDGEGSADTHLVK